MSYSDWYRAVVREITGGFKLHGEEKQALRDAMRKFNLNTFWADGTSPATMARRIETAHN